MTLYWDYEKLEVHISILDYGAEALIFFQNNDPQKMQDQPHLHINPKFGEECNMPKKKILPPSW